MAMGIRNNTLNSGAVFTTKGLRRGLVVATPFILSNGAAGLVMGIAYKGLGLKCATAVLFSTLVYSATAQAVTLGMWSSSPPVGPMILAILLANARYLLMGAHLRQLFERLPRKVMVPILFLLADASWMMTLSDSERSGPDAGYLLGASIPMAVGWVAGTAVGYAVPMNGGGALAATTALLPVAFIVTLLPSQWRGRSAVMPWIVSAGAAVLAATFFSPSWAVLAGGASGTFLHLVADQRA